MKGHAVFDRVSEGRWWDRAWSLVEGCTPCSPGCERCWLQAMDRRFYRGNSGGLSGARFWSSRLSIPGRVRKPTAWAIWSDLFHADVTDLDIAAALRSASAAERHVFLLLTKRAERLVSVAHGLAHRWPRNVWAGVTVCNQEEADRKVSYLMEFLPPVRFLSVEPMLGPVSLKGLPGWGDRALSRIHWVIAGAETGPGARPVDPDWFRTLRDQCRHSGVPFFLKQIDARRGRLLDGRTWDELPEAPRG